MREPLKIIALTKKELVTIIINGLINKGEQLPDVSNGTTDMTFEMDADGAAILRFYRNNKVQP